MKLISKLATSFRVLILPCSGHGRAAIVRGQLASKSDRHKLERDVDGQRKKGFRQLKKMGVSL